MDRFETFATTIAVIHRCLQKIKDREMLPYGLKGTHVMCLYSLGKKSEGLTAAELCGVCGEDKAAVSRTVNDLTEKEYVRLNTDGQKRAYRAKILLTEKGKNVIEYINKRVESALESVGGELSDSQRSDFYKALSLIADNLIKYTKSEATSNEYA